MTGIDLEADCAQNIALLYYLSQNPPERKKHENRGQEPDVTGRTISLSDEKHLVSTLGFLSAIRSDTDNVTAVCVEERESGMLIMVAANAKEAGLSSLYLPSVKEGFDKVFSLLTGALHSPREKLASDVFKTVVSMCRWRILSRLRMINPDDKGPFEEFLTKLREVVSNLSLSDSEMQFLELSQQLESKLAKYRSSFTHPSNDDWALTEDKELESVVQICYMLYEMRDISEPLFEKLKCIRPLPRTTRQKMQQCDAVLIMIRKVGNYKRAAKDLVKLARRYEGIRKATISPVVLDSSAFVQRAPTKFPSFKDMLYKLQAHHGMSWNTNDVDTKVKTKSGIDRLMNEPRVHAEMQLIWHLDQYQGSTTPPPRVIASNKNACYLCNAFIKVHGKYSVPRTHGRLHPGWRLPSSGLQDVKERFSLELKQVAGDKVDLILKEGWKPPRCPPESSVSSAIVSGSSILTIEEYMPDSSDSDETIRPDHGTEIMDTQEQQVEECLSLRQGSPSAQDGSEEEEQTNPDYNEVERNTDSEPLSRPPPGSLSRPLSSQEPQQAPEDEDEDDDGHSTPKAQASQSTENLHHSTVETDADSNPSVASGLSQMVSPETRLSSMSTPASLGKKPCEEKEVIGDKDDAWRQVEKGRHEVVSLPDSLELFVEYTTGSSSKSQNLRFKARRLPEEEVETALNEGATVHDLTSLGYEEVKVKSNGGIMMRVGDQVFVAHLDEFVAPT
ncbi:hypothetical protein CEP54_000798 [Fusarium duplospermum]|uniref:Uncharacterized protein n=1 Tax=Fusarium duplospermum TaxID=1325734 RepID=A0A428R5I0_9HYPO|nr:hypothetical protein CEP54_000798 [Fusarium duplospermum]